MTERTHTPTHERIAQLLAELPPAPWGWVEAARELPRMDSIVERAAADAEYRARVVKDLEAALAEVGLEPEPPLLDELRHRLRDS